MEGLPADICRQFNVASLRGVLNHSIFHPVHWPTLSGRPENSARLRGNRKEGSKTLDVVSYSGLSQSSPECSRIARNYGLAECVLNLLSKGGSGKIRTTQEKGFRVWMIYRYGVPVNFLFRDFRKLTAQFRFNGIEAHSGYFQNLYAVSFQEFLLMLVGGIRIGSCQ